MNFKTPIFVVLLFFTLFSMSSRASLVRVEEYNGVFFGFEHLTNDTANKWHSYATKANEIGPRLAAAAMVLQQNDLSKSHDFFQFLFTDQAFDNLKERSLEEKIAYLRKSQSFFSNLDFLNGMQDGLKNFTSILRQVTHDTTVDGYVAFAAAVDPRTIDFSNPKVFEDFYLSGKLLMAMGVITSKNGGFVVIHMGISRSPFNLLHGPSFPRISTQLHGFSAYTMLRLYPHDAQHPERVTTMVTTPLDDMTKILSQAGLHENEISVGQKQGGSISAPRLRWSGSTITVLDDAGRKIHTSTHNFFNLLHVNYPSIVVDLKNLQRLWPRYSVNDAF